ncbi:hypothetical protein O9X94_04105 [Agrobacterium leguminum]|uniref:Uncharacterized protein n=1 Tax=Agrobacterium leguminum TaxID=2792015 RepID=A0A9X3HJA6_9HYPH|nr:hypothetical protein [Agrobacterium leguminum]MCZ7908482.1 hypothetical protein [Agrobacterium leguminum]
MLDIVMGLACERNGSDCGYATEHLFPVIPALSQNPASPSHWVEKVFSPRRRTPAGCRVKPGMTRRRALAQRAKLDGGWMVNNMAPTIRELAIKPETTLWTVRRLQPQISDCSQTLSNHRHAVKDYFPIFMIFILLAGFAPSSVTYYTQRQAVSTRGESSW